MLYKLLAVYNYNFVVTRADDTAKAICRVYVAVISIRN